MARGRADFRPKLLLNDVQNVTVTRGGKELVIDLPGDFGQLLLDSGIKSPFGVRVPTVIDTVVVGRIAAEAGLLKGDSVVGVNEVNSPFFGDIRPEIVANAGQEIEVRVMREGRLVKLTMTPDSDGTVGFRPVAKMARFFDTDKKEYSFLESFGAGYTHARKELQNYVISLKFLFTKSGIQQIGGFGTIGGIFDAQWNWKTFWDRTAWLSLVLAFMNILPIPALDGGHVVPAGRDDHRP